MAKTEKAPNYTPEQEEQLVALYNEYGNEGMNQIAEALAKSVKSVRGKLVHMKVYVPTPKEAKPVRDEGPTKKELLNTLEGTGFDVTGFENATKAALERLISHFSETDA